MPSQTPPQSPLTAARTMLMTDWMTPMAAVTTAWTKGKTASMTPLMAAPQTSKSRRTNGSTAWTIALMPSIAGARPCMSCVASCTTWPTTAPKAGAMASSALPTTGRTAAASPPTASATDESAGISSPATLPTTGASASPSADMAGPSAPEIAEAAPRTRSMTPSMADITWEESTCGSGMPIPATAPAATFHAAASASETRGARTPPRPARTFGKASMMPLPICATRGATFLATAPMDVRRSSVSLEKSASSRARPVTKFCHAALAMPIEPEIVEAASLAVVPAMPWAF